MCKKFIEELHKARRDAVTWKALMGAKGYAAAVIDRINQEWPGECDWLIVSDIDQLKKKLWKGKQVAVCVCGGALQVQTGCLLLAVAIASHRYRASSRVA